VVNAVHCGAVNARTGPQGSFESRMAIPCVAGATWMQLPLAPLWLLVRHVARGELAVSISRLLCPCIRSALPP
jgi:hypothetical protein